MTLKVKIFNLFNYNYFLNFNALKSYKYIYFLLNLYIDIQSTAVYGTEEEIIQEAEDLVNYWSDEKGSGVIAIDYSDPASVGTRAENSKIALKAFKEAWEEKYSIYKSKK